LADIKITKSALYVRTFLNGTHAIFLKSRLFVLVFSTVFFPECGCVGVGEGP